MESLRELGGDDFVVEVIDTFLADVPTLLATLRRALEAGDAARGSACGAHTEVERRHARGDGVRRASVACSNSRRRTVGSTEAAGLLARIEEERGSLERALEALRPAAAT